MSAICDDHKVGVELLYNSVKTGSQLVWSPDQLETNAVEKASTQQSGPIEQLQLEIRSVGDQTSWREDAGLRNMFQRGWATRPLVKQPRRAGKKRGYGQ